MLIPTEPIGSIPRPAELVSAWADHRSGRISPEQFAEISERALRYTIRRFEETGSPVIMDGEQTKSSFATYPLDDDCGFSPFAHDTSTSRDVAFQKIRARVLGTQMAAEALRHS
jgi:methionine synthase II (cobalamin-independent)